MANFQARLRETIRESGLSVNAAAVAIGIPQPTLAGLLSGRTKHPRASILHQIERHYGLPAGWLFSGGARDARSGWSIAVLRWDELLATLRLPDPIHTSLVDLPVTTAYVTMKLVGDRLATGKPGEYPKATPAFREASRLEHEAWIVWLTEFIALEGREKVRESLIANADGFRLRFAPHEFVAARPNGENLTAANSRTPESNPRSARKQRPRRKS